MLFFKNEKKKETKKNRNKKTEKDIYIPRIRRIFLITEFSLFDLFRCVQVETRDGTSIIFIGQIFFNEIIVDSFLN